MLFRNFFNGLFNCFHGKNEKEIIPPFTNLTPIWDTLPVNIMWQQRHRNNDKNSNQFSFWAVHFQNIEEGINMSIMLNTASMIEGYLEEKARFIYQSKFIKELNDFEERQKEHFFIQLKDATFSKYNGIYSLVTGKNMMEIIGVSNAELWKDIFFLFQLRNIIAHSQSIEMQIDTESGTETVAKVNFKGNFNKIILHLQERKLLDKPIPESMNFKSMYFGSNQADYFYNQGKKFINCIDQELGKLSYKENNELKAIFKEYNL